jgi:hypothetical protein
MTGPADWLDTVHQAWGRNALAATINLRGRPQRLGDDAIRRAEEWERDARGLGWQDELSAEVFANVIRKLVTTGGDPPASPAERALALAVVQGRAPDDVVPRTDALVRRLAPGLDRQLARVTDDTKRAGFRVALAGVAAMLLLARVEVLRLRKELPPSVPGTPDLVGERLQAAFDCPRDDPARRVDLLGAALDVGLVGAPPPPAIPVLEALVYEDLPLAAETLRRCVAAMNAVAAEPPGYTQLGIDDETARVRDDALAAVFGMIAIRADDAALGGELTEAIALALERLLTRNLSPDSRLATGLSAAGGWVRIGRLDRADAILAALRSELSGATAELRLAELEARIRMRCGDRVGATDRLIDALGRSGDEADPAFRRQAILTLIASWPVALDPDAGDPRPGRDGIEWWIDEAERLVETAPSRSIDVFRGELMTALFSLGVYDRGARVRSRINFRAWASSPGFNQWSTDIEQWSSRQARAANSGAPIPPGEEAKSAVELGLDRDFSAGARKARDDARIAIARGLPMDAFTYLAIAAQLHRRAGDLEASVDAFGRAFALLETDLHYIPYPELVITRLAAWPDRYLVAALTALDAGQSERALSFAETGRGRVIAGQLGTMGHPPTDTIGSADWERFRGLWRRIAAQAASDLYSTSDLSSVPHPRQTDRDSAATLVAELTALRRQFAAAGAAPGALTPVTPPDTVSDTPAWLAAADRPTVVLYSLIAEDRLRLIKITTDGAAVIEDDPASLRVVLDAVRAYSDQIRHARNVEAAVRDLLPGLLAETGPRLEPALRQAIDGYRGGRLVWVPQGVLAALPIHALPLDGEHVCDAIAVIVAESLASVGAALTGARTMNVRPVAIRGRPSDAASTDGAAALLPTGATEYLVSSAEELEAALWLDSRPSDGHQSGATMIHLDCHGVFEWRDPLASHLRLGGQFDLSVGDLFDSITIDPGAIVILDSCDSGTIAQTDLNDGIGIPAGLLAAGARSIIAAGWPVARLASVGACRKVIESLTGGVASPEALQGATCWLRDATVGDIRDALAAVRHPYAEEVPDQDPEFLVRKLDDPWLWAAFMHWGAPWRAAPPVG